MDKAAKLSGRVAVVTGAASGIGAASAEALAAAGATVVVADTDDHGGAQVVERITGAGGIASFVTCDVTDEISVTGLMETTIERYGALDIAHNNAGLSGMNAPLTQQSTQSWDRLVAVNLTGVFLCLRAELQVMIPRGRGAIINTASNAGLRGLPHLGPYVATKFGVIGLTKSAAVENAHHGIRINAVGPGATHSPLLAGVLEADPDLERRIATTVPLGRVGEPHEIAQAVVWLASDDSSYVCGTTLMVDGGNTAT